MYLVNTSEIEKNTYRTHDIYGFLVGDNILVNMQHGVVLRFTHYGVRQCRCDVGPVMFGETEIRLLTYLLLNADGKIANYNGVLMSVWEDNGLVSSYKRLSQVVQSLKGKLSQSGLPNDFIRTVRKQGYCIEGHVIIPLYYHVNSSIV